MHHFYFFLRYFSGIQMLSIRTVAILLFLCRLPSWGQSVSSINFNYLYDPAAEVTVQIKPIHRGDSMLVFFRMRSANLQPTPYILKWEKKESYGQRQGALISPADTVQSTDSWIFGQFRFAKPEKPWLLAVKVINQSTAKSWVFFHHVEAHYPVNGYVEKDGKQVWSSYLSASERYTVRRSGSGKPVHFSFYRDNFPTPSPPFVVKEIKMDRFLFPDSTFSVLPGADVGPFAREGLYLAQEDTASTQGFSFVVKKDPYPKYNKLADLKGPLLFVTTREENDALGAAGEDKLAFDKIILTITKDKERARTFMRNYFKRVEYANFYFTSFKEGWKTDRGMILVIFGIPDEVQLDGQQEIWMYKNPRQEFQFTRAGSVYHPDHSVLVREKGYSENWYLTIDLWRKSRF